MEMLIRNSRLDRRQFLRVVFISASAALTPLLSASKSLPLPQSKRQYHLFRGATDGKVFGSKDGRNWALLKDFGSSLPVQAVEVAPDGWIHARLLAGDLSFILKSRDTETWYTQDYFDPGTL